MITIKPISDPGELMSWRAEVIRNVFGVVPDESLLAANRDYYSGHIATGEHMAFVAVTEGEECGCGGVCFYEELPSPDNSSGRCAYLMNIYVRETFRNRGIGHSIVSRLIEEAKLRRCGKIYLETTGEGKSLYSSLGFREMPDMMKYELEI